MVHGDMKMIVLLIVELQYQMVGPNKVSLEDIQATQEEIQEAREEVHSIFITMI